ncbi:phosphoesterase [Methanocella sp. CWC-04]|uniref:Phosphoesterase n=1 Tax=Methanooceanicella nereidis TaxID=2052831 RepID=A0AAP2RCF7_9EURY|nr:DHH family phosphoesterase [Methanocella sp. CWC-04]MCD1293732.1 phosphoesterase [Methanocella sp. CWC-04]
MSIECPTCLGKGYHIKDEQTCEQCDGTGKAAKSVNLMSVQEKDIKAMLSGFCPKCKGSGKIQVREKCKDCAGTGKLSSCQVCGKPLKAGYDLCADCRDMRPVFKLGPACDVSDLDIGKTYLGKVANLADFGVFVNLNDQTKGLIHSSNVRKPYVPGEEVMVKINTIKPNGNFDLIPHKVTEFKLIEVEKKLPRTNASDINKFVNKLVSVSGEVVQIKQTSGPTIFTVTEETGTVSCAAFVEAGMRAYPDVTLEDIVRVTGEITMRNNGLQLEVLDMKKLAGDDAAEIKTIIENAIDERAKPAHVEFLVESEVLEKLRPQMEKVAHRIRRAILKSQPIVVRHHADADGICAGVAVERACLPLIKKQGDTDAEYHFFGRSPSKAPFYELEDINKDLVMALEDNERFGQTMPLILLMDNGSTEEDMDAYKYAKVYGLDLLVVDHHHPDEIVDQYVKGHVNPYHVGGDFGITAGMLGTELARMINPDVENEVKHLAAVAAVGDRSEAPERAKYLALVQEKYPENELKKIALALDYEQFWLRYNDGRGIVNDILNFNSEARHKALVELLYEQANMMITNQLETSMPHVKTAELPSGALLHVIDVENFAHKFTFPAPGKTTGEIHDLMCKKYEGKPIVTLGFGPDFAVLRSRGVQMNIPRMVRELREEIKGGGVSGGGHLVVGSIKFVEGMRKDVLDALTHKIGQAPV